MEWDNESLVKQIQTGQGNRNELLERLWTDNIRLIRKIIHEMTGLERERDRQDFEDLEQQAFLGIMDCIQRFDSSRGKKFFTFAIHYIRKSIMQYYDSAGQTMRVPAYMRAHIRAYMREKERQKGNGMPATDESIRKALGMSNGTLQSTLRTIRKMEMQSLDSYLNESDKDSGTILDMIAGNENTSETAMISVHDKELKDLLRSILQSLPDTEREILIARHYQRMRTEQIAKAMNCTPQNVSQHAKTAYKRIRTGKHGKELLTFLPERAIERSAQRIENDFKELSEQERGLLI